MPTLSLTARNVADAVGSTQAETLYWDDRLKGFGLKITPAGSRVFLLQYWSPTKRGAKRRFTLGELGESIQHPDGRSVRLTAQAAREIAEVLKGRVASGLDPFLERQRDERAKLARDAQEAAASRARKEAELRERANQRTLADVATRALEDWRARTLLPIGARQRLAPKTVRERERLLEKHILPTLGRRPVRQIARADAEEMRRAMGSRTPILANRVQQLCHVLLESAEERAGSPNPFSHGRGKRGQWFEERETRRPISALELKGLLTALDEDDATERGGAHDAIRLLAYTGWRKSEVLSLRWSSIDLDTGEAVLPDTKTGRSERSLAGLSIALLRGIPRRSEFVFPNPGDLSRPRVEIRRVWNRVRARAGVDKPLHSLRHGFATTALSVGLPLASVGALLGHRDPATTLRYAKLEENTRREAARAVDAALLKSVPVKGTRVIPLRGSNARAS